MDVDSTINADNEEELQLEETDDSCRFDFTEIIPVARDTDGSCTTECVSGDWSDEVKQENLTVVKQEPDNVCCVIYVAVSLSQKKEFMQFFHNCYLLYIYIYIYYLRAFSGSNNSV